MDIYSKYPDAKVIKLNGNTVTIDGEDVKEYDYVWSFTPDMKEPTYTGEKPENEDIYIAHDIIYYPEIDTSLFEKINYDGEMEWVTYYSNEELKDYIFSTLPVLGEEIPTSMMHSADEAYNNPVLHITKEGTYILEGNWSGQIYVDLGDKDEVSLDASKKVNIILNGVDVKCCVAPSIVFYSAYECDNAWEENDTHSDIIDTTEAGVNVILSDGTVNNFTGSNVYRLLKAKYKNETSKVQKKYYKLDGAFYSYVSMNIEGNSGILNITSTTFEGLDSELHLTINGGYINIVSQDDGINVNEDKVSVFTMNDGRLTIFSGQGYEGDVIDSNGYIRINGGTLLGTSPSVMDNILDSDSGTYTSENATVISNVAGITRGQNGFNGGFKGEFNQEGMEPHRFNERGEFMPNDGFNFKDFKNERPIN